MTLNFKKKVTDFIKSKKAKVLGAVSAAAVMALPITASAAETDTVSYFKVTDAMVAPLVSAINSGLTTMMPIGITCLASFIGINVVKRVIYSFI